MGRHVMKGHTGIVRTARKYIFLCFLGCSVEVSSELFSSFPLIRSYFWGPVTASSYMVEANVENNRKTEKYITLRLQAPVKPDPQ